jgi:hypothetical protein
MNGDPGSLDNLRDLALPPPVPLLPPAPGILILAAGLLAALAIFLWRSYALHRANAYRRAALAELDAIASASQSSVADVSAVLKRAALVAYPRERVAPLTGAAWARFLATTGGRGFDAAGMDALLADAFGSARTSDAGAWKRLLSQARIWVRGHVVADAGE